MSRTVAEGTYGHKITRPAGDRIVNPIEMTGMSPIQDPVVKRSAITEGEKVR